jgi:hypothetical protein
VPNRTVRALAVVGMAVLVMLGGCATQTTPQPQLMWYKVGATQKDFLQDRYACTQEAQVLPQNSALLSSSYHLARSLALFTQCMNARGWEQRKVE